MPPKPQGSVNDPSETAITPMAFINKWGQSTLKESAAYQDHFRDLCRLVGYQVSSEEEAGLFQKHVDKISGAKGFADVWLMGKFAIEYKSPGEDLDKAYQQLQDYRDALGNPPLLVVSDTRRIRIITNFTGTKPLKHEITPLNFETQASQKLLKALFHDPASLNPARQVEAVTLDAAREVAAIARRLEARKIPSMEVAHFLMKMIFVFFASHAGLLPKQVVSQIFDGATKKPELAKGFLERLFKAMQKGDKGEAYLGEEIWYFNGGLFDDASALPLDLEDLKSLQRVASLDWTGVDPVIFGNLYEYGLGAEARTQRGVHYTSREDILLLLDPVLFRPWRARWKDLKTEMETELAKAPKGKARKSMEARLEAFRDNLGGIRVLDPACGSGNFLLVALQGLMDLENEVVHFIAHHFRHGQAALAWNFRTSPRQLHGIEILPFPRELASVVVWIGHLQWLMSHGYWHREEPILTRLDPIQLGDALGLPWPDVDVIVGNPPFIGSKKLRKNLGDATVDTLFAQWKGQVPSEADYVCYWFEKARQHVANKKARRVGFLATDSIRQGKNRVVLNQIAATSDIFFGISVHKWTLKGAAVSVSLVGFGAREEAEPRELDGVEVSIIHPNLSATFDTSQAKRLADNQGRSFMGDTKGGPFEVPLELAQTWLAMPLNPNGKPNSDVLKPWANGLDITRRPQNQWILDFGMGRATNPAAVVPGMLHLPETELAYYAEPWAYALKHIKPAWAASRTGQRREWFIHAEPRPAMRRSLHGLDRFLVTPRIAKHRLFCWLDKSVLPDSALIVFATDRDADLGLLQSRIHEIWALAMCSSLEDRPRYTPNTTFETFPFPDCFKSDPPQAIVDAAKTLDSRRSAWLNPEGASVDALKERTLTNLYNRRESGEEVWLNNLHRDLDRAVLDAYGWSDLAEPLFEAEDALRALNAKGESLALALGKTEVGVILLMRLLALNQNRTCI